MARSRDGRDGRLAVAHPRTFLAHAFGEPDRVVEWSAREKAVAKVEDVTRPRSGTTEYVERFRLEHIARREQRHRVQIALNGEMVPHARPPSSSGVRQSRPMTVAPAVRMAGSSVAVVTPK